MFSVKAVSLETIIDMLSCVEEVSGNRKELTTVLEGRRGNQKSFTLTIPLNLAKLVKIFPGIIVRQNLTIQKQMGLVREWYVGFEERHPAVLLQSGLDEN